MLPPSSSVSPKVSDVVAVRAALAGGLSGVRSRFSGGVEEWLHPVTGTLHRLDGPASSGRVVSWYVDGVRHREGGPAETCDEFERWWRFGVLHRTEGPAVQMFNGQRQWAVDGQVISEEDDWTELSWLFESGQADRLEQVLTLWRPVGPSVVELSEAVAAANA